MMQRLQKVIKDMTPRQKLLLIGAVAILLVVSAGGFSGELFRESNEALKQFYTIETVLAAHGGCHGSACGQNVYCGDTAATEKTCDVPLRNSWIKPLNPTTKLPDWGWWQNYWCTQTGQPPGIGACNTSNWEKLIQRALTENFNPVLLTSIWRGESGFGEVGKLLGCSGSTSDKMDQQLDCFFRDSPQGTGGYCAGFKAGSPGTGGANCGGYRTDFCDFTHCYYNWGSCDIGDPVITTDAAPGAEHWLYAYSKMVTGDTNASTGAGCGYNPVPPPAPIAGFQRGFPVSRDTALPATAGLCISAYPNAPNHSIPAIDISSDSASIRNHPVVSVTNGTAVYTQNAGGYGNLVAIGENFVVNSISYVARFLYGHLLSSTIPLFPGSKPVVTGEEVGRINATGVETGDHLHYEVWVNDQVHNPCWYSDYLQNLPHCSVYSGAPDGVCSWKVYPPPPPPPPPSSNCDFTDNFFRACFFEGATLNPLGVKLGVGVDDSDSATPEGTSTFPAPEGTGINPYVALNRNYGMGEINQSGKSDNAVGIWKGRINFSGGPYVFFVKSDDNHILLVEDKNNATTRWFVDWPSGGQRADHYHSYGPIYLEGYTRLTFIWNDLLGPASFELSWTKVSVGSIGCADTCPGVGAQQCNGSGAYKVCGDYNGDGCVEWGQDTVCASGTVCSSSTNSCTVPTQCIPTNPGAAVPENPPLGATGVPTTNVGLSWRAPGSWGTSCSP